MKNYWADLLFLGGYIATPAALAAVTGEQMPIVESKLTNKQVVEQFLREVRAGKKPENVTRYLSPHVLAHQMNAENELVVERTPENYADHVRDFKRIWGDFDFTITELIAEGDRVYARWKQTGCHIAPIDEHAPSGFPVIEIASAVYRVENGKIAEYWIQVDRKGIEEQIENNASSTDNKVRCIR